MSDSDSQIKRVIDLIAHLQNHDPVAPVQVWTHLHDARRKVLRVVQVNPSYLKEHQISGDPRDDEAGPYPVVVIVE